MNNGALTALKVLMWCVCAFHLAVGAGVNLSSEDFPRIVALFFFGLAAALVVCERVASKKGATLGAG